MVIGMKYASSVDGAIEALKKAYLFGVWEKGN